MKKRQIPPFNPPNSDNCPIMQEFSRIKKEMAEERRRDSEGLKAWGDAQAEACGIETIDENHPWLKGAAEKRRQRLAAEKAEQESTVPVPATAKVLAE